MFQAIIRSILISGRLGPNIKHVGCYGLLLKHLKSEELHWLHPDLTVGEVEQRYESHHVEAEWRCDAQHPAPERPKHVCRSFVRLVLFPLAAGMTFASDTSRSISWRNSKMTDLPCSTFISR